MKILFLGDIVGPSGCKVVKKYLPDVIKNKAIDFVVANGENAADNGAGITEKISNELFECGDITIVIPLEKSNLSFPLPFDIAILFRLCNFRIPKPFWVTSF